jgi:hypothetical protein
MKKILVLVLLLVSIFASSLTVDASGTGIIGPDVIHKEQNKILTIIDILSLYSSSTGTVQIQTDNYTGYGNVLGTHSLSLMATNGTITVTKDIQIIVVPLLGNVKAVTDEKNILLLESQVLTPSNIVSVLSNTGYITITATTQMMLLTNTYTDNASEPGQYFFEFRLVNSAGVDMVYSSIITVIDDVNPFIPDITFEAPKTGVQIFLETILNLLIAAAAIYGVVMIFKFVMKQRKQVI